MCLFNRYPELHYMDQNLKVLEASMLLRKHGSKLQETEFFNAAMLSAVKSFQKKHGLEMSGIVDKKTWKALKKKHIKC